MCWFPYTCTPHCMHVYMCTLIYGQESIILGTASTSECMVHHARLVLHAWECFSGCLWLLLSRPTTAPYHSNHQKLINVSDVCSTWHEHEILSRFACHRILTGSRLPCTAHMMDEIAKWSMHVSIGVYIILLPVKRVYYFHNIMGCLKMFAQLVEIMTATAYIWNIGRCSLYI